MIKTPLSTVIGGAFWTPGATVINEKGIFSVFVKSLFANGEQGFWYDPNDMGTMYQDAAGTVPVTGVGQSVGLIRDKSGRNNHAYQTASASRPILRQNAVTGANYLAFDGSDDFLQTSNIDFTSTDKVSLFAGVRKLSDAAPSVLLELSSSANAYNGAFFITAPQGIYTTMSYGFKTRGLLVSTATGYTVANNLAPVSNVLSCKFNLAGATRELGVIPRINGVLSQQFPDSGTINNGGTYGNYPLYIGRRAGTSSPFNGHIYGLIGVGKLVSDNDTLVVEKELAKQVGVAL